MSDDVTIPRDTAKEWAAFLRASTRDRLNPGWTPLADILDPQPSLRDEAIRIIENITLDDGQVADAVLALARTRIEGLETFHGGALTPVAGYLRLDDVLALLGGDDE